MQHFILYLWNNITHIFFSAYGCVDFDSDPPLYWWLKPTDHDDANVFHAMFNSIAIMCHYVQYNLKIPVILMPETHLLQFSKFKD